MALDTGIKRHSTSRAPARRHGGREGGWRWWRPLAVLGGLARSRITVMMVVINAVALGIMVLGVLQIGGLRERLLDERVKTLAIQARVLAERIGDAATDDLRPGLLEDQVPAALSDIYIPTSTRVRVFNERGEEVKRADSYNLKEFVETGALEDLPADFRERFEQVAPTMRAGLWVEGTAYETLAEEVAAAMLLRPDISAPTSANPYPVAASERRDELGNVIISVSTPITRVKLVRGVVNVESRGFDDIIQQQRDVLWAVTALAAAVAAGSSVLGAILITWPVRHLSEAAHRIGREGPNNAHIPHILGNWEVGRLSRAMASMASALVNRFAAIEGFSADVAHELKNPLTSLRSALEIFAHTDDAARRERLLAVMSEDFKRLDRLITDISQAGRMDAELSRAQAHRLDLQAFLRELVEMYHLTRNPGEPDVVFDGAVQARPIHVRAADEPLGHVFRNLIDNARTFSPVDAPVRIRLRRDVRAGRPVAIAEVEDAGPGVPEENLSRIFNRFYTSRTNGDEGRVNDHSGLGLAIAKQIVEAHHGEIWAANVAGIDGRSAGARFSIALPLDG